MKAFPHKHAPDAATGFEDFLNRWAGPDCRVGWEDRRDSKGRLCCISIKRYKALQREYLRMGGDPEQVSPEVARRAGYIRDGKGRYQPARRGG